MAEYVILYTGYGQGQPTDKRSEAITAADDAEAIKRYKAFKKEKEKDNGKYFWSYTVDGLERIDQEERTTKIR